VSRRKKRSRRGRENQREDARARTDLERRWRSRLQRDPSLATLVTASAARREPYHRWLPYRLGFAPALVRRFLDEERPGPAPVLDPFSGSGTTVIECARRGSRAIGVEVEPGLVAASGAAFLRGAGPDLPPLASAPAHAGGFRHVAASLEAPVHRAAVLAAVGRRLRANGSWRSARGVDAGACIQDALCVIREDLQSPLRAKGFVLEGDARRLPLRPSSVGGVLTSPPYIARFDVRRVVSGLTKVLRVWNNPASSPPGASGSGQLPAWRSDRTCCALDGGAGHPAVREVQTLLEAAGRAPAAALVGAYFAGLGAAISELGRVVQRGAPIWIVVGGAFLFDVYVPSDLLVAELAEEAGLQVIRLLWARDLAHSSGRRLGDLAGVKPRETVVVARRVR